MVELLPGIPGDPIRVALHHRTLSDLPTCSAVSYEWGSNVRELVIFCDDRVLKVTANLLLLLSKFRSSDSSQLLWIDAICINQEDLDERSQQVQLMGKIYKNAAVVLMWIGDQTPYTGDAIPIFRRLAELLHTFKLKPGKNELDFLPYADHQDLDSSSKEYLWNIRQSSWTGMIDLLSRDYFGRLWIIQEIVLSSKAVVVCGNHQIEWKIFYKTAMCLFILGLEYLPKAVVRTSVDHTFGISMLGQLNFHRITFSLLRIARFFPDSKVTDPRDYVYGYLGILDSHSHKHEIHVDYSSTVEEVFRKATEKVAIEERGLDYLSDQTVEPNSRPRATMPSWVRDWGFLQDSFQPCPVPEVAERLGAEQTVFVDGNYLTAHGLIIDSTEEVSDNLQEGNLEQIMLGTFVNLLSGLSEMTAADVSMAARKTLECFDALAQTRSEPISEKSFFVLLASIHLELLAYLGLGPWASSQNPKVGTWRKAKRSLRSRKSEEFGEDTNIVRLAQKNVLLQWSTEQSACAEELDLSSCAVELAHRLFLDDRSLGVNMFKGTKGFRGHGPAGRNACVDDPPAVRIGDYIALFPTLALPMILREGDCEGVYTLIGTAHVANLTEIPWYEGETPSLVPIRMN
jgi:hypothetical protein